MATGWASFLPLEEDRTEMGLFKELTQVTVTLDLLVRKTLREPYLAIFCEPPVPKR